MQEAPPGRPSPASTSRILPLGLAAHLTKSLPQRDDLDAIILWWQGLSLVGHLLSIEPDGLG
jgi:hypothetical protein